MWRATSIDLKKARPNPASPLLSPTFAVAAAALVAADCSTQNGRRRPRRRAGSQQARPLRPPCSPAPGEVNFVDGSFAATGSCVAPDRVRCR